MSPTLKFSALVTGTATLLLSAMASAQAATVFTNRTDWQNAVNAITGSVTTTDTFSTDIPKAQSINLTSGIVSTNSLPPSVFSNIFDNNSVLSGLYSNATQSPAGTASETVTWTFPSSVFAFGADFLSTNLDRLTLSGNFDGTGNQTFVVNNTIGGADGFLGIIGNANFNSVVFGNNSTVVDGFDIDNPSFATTVAPPVATPEPSTLGTLFLFGLGFLGLKGRRGEN